MKNFFSRVLPALIIFTVLVAVLFLIPHSPGAAVLAFTLPVFGRRISKAVAKGKANQMKNLDVQFISLVEVPANNKPVLIKSRDGKGSHFQIDAKIVKYDEKEGIAYGIAYPSNEVDLQEDFISKEDLQKAAHNFLLKARQGNVDYEHNLQKGAADGIVESHILDAPDSRYPDSKADDWGVAIKLSDEFKKSGKTFKGFSIYGTCDYVQKDASDVTTGEGDPDGDGKLLQRLRVAAKVADTDMAEALQVDHDEYMQIENGTAEFDWTDPTIAAASKKLQIPEPLFATLMNYNASDTADDTSTEGDNPAASNGAGTLPQTSIDNGAGSGKSVNFKQPMPKIKIKSRAIADEKVFLSKGVYDVPVIVDGDGQLFARPIDHEQKKKHNIGLVKKAILSQAFVGEAKKDYISKADVASTDFGFFDATDVLNPELAASLISVVVDQTPMLKEVQTKMVERRDAEIDVMDVTPRTARRIPAGSPPGTSSGQSPINRSFQVHTAEIDLVVKIDNKTIRETSNLAGLEETTFNNFIAGFKNDILDLGINGVGGVFVDDGAHFLNLKKGWLALLNTAPGAGSPGVPVAQNISAAGILPSVFTGGNMTDIEAVFAAMKAAGIANNPRFAWDDMPYIFGSTDGLAYRTQLKDRPDSLVAQAIWKGGPMEYDNNPINKVNFMPTQNGILTNLSNLGVAILKGGGAPGDGIIMERHTLEKAIELIMTIQVDYFVVNPLAAVLLRP